MQKIHAHLALTPKGWVRDLCIEIKDSRIAQVSTGLPKDHYSIDFDTEISDPTFGCEGKVRMDFLHGSSPLTF